MDVKIERSLRLPQKSFLLLGPRGTGKSTLLKMSVPARLEVNLLKSVHFLPLQQNPSLLQEWVGHLKAGDWVVVDEVQKIPALMDEIHAIYEEKRLHFAITGSSARKLKRGGANLLAGRALRVDLFPFVRSEIKDLLPLRDVLDWGCLPAVVLDVENRRETLATYVETYLRQELVEEGLIRKLEPFVRFLKVAGMHNAQILNVENIAREAHLKRTTVDSYFEVLEDTLIGYRLPAIKLNIHSKELQHPKFYFFDSGVARASAGLIFDEVDSVWRGFALETWILNEVRAFNSYQKRGKEFYYYKATGGSELDLVIETQRKTLSKPRELIGIEIKSASSWDRKWTRGLLRVQEEKKSGIKRSIGIYLGSRTLTQDGVDIFPVQKFVEELYAGRIF
jgi:predicted AAA+ superfamily ATPase